MNSSYNNGVPSPHLFRSNPVRTTYPHSFIAQDSPPAYRPISRRPPDYYSSNLNPLTYQDPGSNLSPHSNFSPCPDPLSYSGTSYYQRPGIHSGSYSPYYKQYAQTPTTFPAVGGNFNALAYNNSSSYPVNPSASFAYPASHFPSSSQGLTAWSAGMRPSLSEKGLETILIAILILAALDLIIIRPQKENSLRG